MFFVVFNDKWYGKVLIYSSEKVIVNLANSFLRCDQNDRKFYQHQSNID